MVKYAILLRKISFFTMYKKKNDIESQLNQKLVAVNKMNCDILCNFTCKIAVKLSKYHYILSNFRFRNVRIANNKSAKTQ